MPIESILFTRAFRLKIANFHPLPCLYQTSRFITQTPSPCNGYLGHPFEKKAAWAFFVRLFLVVRRDSAIDRGGESFSFPRKNSGEWTANHHGRHAKAAAEACHRLLQAGRAQLNGAR